MSENIVDFDLITRIDTGLIIVAMDMYVVIINAQYIQDDRKRIARVMKMMRGSGG